MQVKDMVNKLKEFQLAFNSHYSTEPTLLKHIEDCYLRYNLLKEENEEYLEACEQGDMVEILDAVVDQLFLVIGTAVSHGLQDVLEEAFNEVHASNMSKLDDDGQPIINGLNGMWDPSRPNGKVLKSKNYFEPNLKKFL